LCLAGCFTNNTPPAKNELHVNFQEGDIPSLHPHEIALTLRGLSIGKTLFEGLTRIDAKGKVQLAGASRVEISSDGLHYLFHLRDNRWSNGMIVTAAQYEAAWKKALESNCPLKELFFFIKNGSAIQRNELSMENLGVRALGKKILSVTLESPCPDFLKHLSQPVFFPLLHCKRKTQMEFNGPFLVALWDKDEHLCLKANPYFWNRENISLRQIDVFMSSDLEGIDWMEGSLCPDLKGYAIDSSGAVDFSYALFE